MAEPKSAGNASSGEGAEPFGSPAVRADPLPLAEATGADAAAARPTGESSALIEPVASGTSAPQGIGRSLAGRRPERRRFLPPIAETVRAAHRDPPPLAHLRAQKPQQTAASPLDREPHGDAGRLGAEAVPAGSRSSRRWLRRTAVIVGTAGALSLIVAAEIGGPAWFGRLRTIVARQLAPPPAFKADVAPPTGPGRRVAYYREHAAGGDADAQIALAVLYAKGEGVGQDYAVAAKWFRAAADKGRARAQYDLGVLYERGRGVPVDYAEATAWYRKAAEQNHPLAEYNLAVAYTKGRGVPRDFFTAALWYHRAADRGVVAAMVNLAILYERGEGVDRSAADAYAWYRAAARRGSQPAGHRAETLLRGFSPADQSRAEAKTAAVAAAIRDPVGERARLAAQSPPSAAGEDGAILKSGIESGARSPADRDKETETP